MSLLDDARRLASPTISASCDFCTGSPMSGHLPDCPILAIPKIVAVLEAAQAAVDAYRPERTWADVMLRLDDALRGKAPTA